MQARWSFLIRIFAWAVGSAGDRGIEGKSTHSLQVSMDEVEAMEILQPMSDIDQLWETVIPVSADVNVATHKLDSVRFCVTLI